MTPPIATAAAVPDAPATPKEFWDHKILRWERQRYSGWAAFYPFAWSVRARLELSYEVIRARAPGSWKILELGCGSGVLAERLRPHYARYEGYDFAECAIAVARERVPDYVFGARDVLEMEMPEADLTVLMGVTDWLHPEQVAYVLSRVRSGAVLLSYTDAARWNPYRFYRKVVDEPVRDSMKARTYRRGEVERMLAAEGFSCELIQGPSFFNPGAMVWAKR